VKVRKAEVHFMPLRSVPDPELIESVKEHGIQVPPLLLRLSEETRRRLRTNCYEYPIKRGGVEEDVFKGY
jgi:hypothetical protein